MLILAQLIKKILFLIHFKNEITPVDKISLMNEKLN